MDVVLVVVWTVVVDHQDQVLDVQPPGRHRGRYQQFDVTILEVDDGAVPVVLVDATVERHAGVGVGH